MSDKMSERVLCVGSKYVEYLHELGEFSGAFAPRFTCLEMVFVHGLDSFIPRRQCEGNPSWKQIIPYVAFVAGAEVFTYTRGKTGGEGRLHALRSLGVGGHVSEDDMAGASGIQGLMAAMKREIDEEVVMPTLPWKVEILGLIHEPESPNPVDRDHVGVLVVAHLHWPDVRAREDCLADARFEKLDDVRAGAEKHERWSQIAMGRLGR